MNVVPGLGEEAGAALAAHPGVQHISFTGSVGVGKLIQRAAADNVVPVTLELGGKSPQLVFDDADIDAALPYLVNAGIQNAGQTCSAGSRALLQRDIYDTVMAGLAERIGSRREVVSRALSALEKENLLGKTRGALVLPDPGELNARISQKGLWVDLD